MAAVALEVVAVLSAPSVRGGFSRLRPAACRARRLGGLPSGSPVVRLSCARRLGCLPFASPAVRLSCARRLGCLPSGSPAARQSCLCLCCAPACQAACLSKVACSFARVCLVCCSLSVFLLAFRSPARCSPPNCPPAGWSLSGSPSHNRLVACWLLLGSLRKGCFACCSLASRSALAAVSGGLGASCCCSAGPLCDTSRLGRPLQQILKIFATVWQTRLLS